MAEYTIVLTCDDDAPVWIAERQDIPGLILEAKSAGASLSYKLQVVSCKRLFTGGKLLVISCKVTSGNRLVGKSCL